MGVQPIKDVTLIRHAYVRPEFQKQGIGGKLLLAIREQTKHPLLIGTWADALWAIRFYEKHGFEEIAKQDLPAGFPVAHVDSKFYRLTL